MGVPKVEDKFLKFVNICHTYNSIKLATGSVGYNNQNKVHTTLKPTEDVIVSMVGGQAAGVPGLVYGAKKGPKAWFGANSIAQIAYNSSYKQYFFGIQFWGTCHGSTQAPSYFTVYPIFN